MKHGSIRARQARVSFSVRDAWMCTVVCCTLICAWQPQSASAQANNFAAPFLLQPVGARTVGHGEAAVADTMLGTEAMWWNPAGMGRMRKREFAVHFSQTFSATNTMVGIAVPSAALGTIAASALIVNFGDILATDGSGAVTGTSTNRYYVLAAAYATPVGKRFSAGFTAKHVMLRFVCNGCLVDQPNLIGSSNAIDVGAQYIVPIALPLTIGASVRNLGQALQVKDADQADPLPRVVQVGARSKLPIAALEKNSTSLNVMADLLLSPLLHSPSIRTGADLSYKEMYTLRAGYKYLSSEDGNEGGLTVGVGVRYNSLEFDLARRFDNSANLGESSVPTYVSLRIVF